MAPRNGARSEGFFQERGLHIITESQYFGGFIGDGEVEKSWLDRKVEIQAESVGTLARVPRKHLQSAYAGLQKSLQ